MRIKTFFASILIIIAEFFGVIQPVHAQEDMYWSIENFAVHVDVQEDASLFVTEEITVNFRTNKHGIFRNIPYVYRDALGNKLRIDLAPVSILRNGQPEQYTKSRSGGDVIYKIGNPDMTVSGVQVYTISYTADQVMLFGDGFDQLYWNATGTEWPVPVLKSSAVITYPDGVQITEQSCYTGEAGSTAQDCGYAFGEQSIAFAAEDFLTVAVNFTDGFFVEPTTGEKIIAFIKANWPIVIPFILLFSALAIWWKWGKDPEMESVIAEYEPPEGISAVYMGPLDRTFVARTDISAMIVQMAVQGYVHFLDASNQKTGDIILQKKRDAEGLDEAHTLLFNEVFAKRDEVRISDLQKSIDAKKMTAIKKAIMQHIKSKTFFEKGSFVWRGVFIAIGIVEMYAAVVSVGLVGMFVGVAFFITAIATITLGWFMPKTTLRGVSILRQVRGFKLFIRTAHKYRAVWEEKEGIFADYLPYAMVFGYTKRWASAFEDLEFKQPDWYHGGRFLTVTQFTNHFDAAMTQVGVALAPPSSSSNASGGGFSGGGFGGGGGGSW